jgi:hypothetical protein
MKIFGAVTEVSDAGDTLVIKIQGTTVNSPDWVGQHTQILVVPRSPHYDGSYYVGRKVEMTITPLRR